MNGRRIFRERMVGDIRTRIGDQICDDKTVRELCEITAFESMEYAFEDFKTKAALAEDAFVTMRCELEILQHYMDDPLVTEIMVNGPENIFIEKDGAIFKAPESFVSTEHLLQLIQRIAGEVGREFNELHPIVDARLKNGSRINAVHWKIAPDGPILTIRKFTQNTMSMGEMILAGCISGEAADFLQKAVLAGYNIFISGGTSSGKTTFLNVLTDFIPADERIIVIEDSLELQVRNHKNLVRMEAKNSNAQGKGSVTLRDLIRSSLRMRPDRIIVGEVRGDEVVDMIAAMSTGHDGSLSTGHANSSMGMLKRLEAMYLGACDYPLQSVQGQIAQALEILVHLEKCADGSRRVVEICELSEYKNGEPVLNRLFRRNSEGKLERTGELKRKEKYDRLQRV